MATTSDLGKWMITNGGNYNAEATYEQLTMVMYNNSTYITLKTVTGVTPSNDGVNYILMAQGFEAEALASVTATDTSGLLGNVGETVSAQSLVDYLADAVATKLLKKTDMSNVQVNDQNKVPTSALAYTMSQDIAELNSDLSSVSDELETVTANLSDVEAQAKAQKYSEDETDHSETVYSLFKNSILYWGNFRNLTYHFRISDNADSTFGDGHFVAYIFRDNAGAVFSAFIINKWTGDAWSMIFRSYDDTKYIKKLS